MEQYLDKIKSLKARIKKSLASDKDKELTKSLKDINAEYKVIHENISRTTSKVKPFSLSTFSKKINEAKKMTAKKAEAAVDEMFEPLIHMLTTDKQNQKKGFGKSRSGTLIYSDRISMTRNPSLNGIFQFDPYKPGTILTPDKDNDEEQTDVVIPGALPQCTNLQFPNPPNNDVAIRADVIKPSGSSPMSGIDSAAFLEPAFVGYLIENEMSELTNYDVWLNLRELEDNEESKRYYELELAVEKKKFEEARFKTKYCKAGDAPNPKIHRGSRLLKLPNYLGEKDFRSVGLYQGGSVYPNFPPLDFDSLLREYIQPLAKSQKVFFNLDSVSESKIRAFYKSKYEGLFNNSILDAGVNATNHLLSNTDFQEYAKEANKSGSVPAYSLSNWIDGDHSTNLRDEIKTLLSGLNIPTEQIINSNILTSEKFIESFNRYCVPIVFQNQAFTDKVTVEEREFTIKSSEISINSDEVQSQENFKAVLDNFALYYELIWNKGREILKSEEIIESNLISPYEFRCIVYVHANYVIKALVRSFLNNQEIGDWLDSFNNWVINNIPPSFWKDRGEEYWKAIGTSKKINPLLLEDISSILRSYLKLYDTYISFSPSSELGAISNPQNPESINIYEKWKQTLIEYLDHNAEKRNQIDSNFLLLKIAPRKGAYGEVPRGKGDLLKLSPNHPSRISRAYQLEYLPEHFFCKANPKIFLREDYSIKLQHQGYGIGEHLFSMSLLPDEKQTISMKSYKDTSINESESQAENIFEEEGKETSDDFSKEMNAENQSESSNDSSTYVDAKVSGSAPFVSAEVKAGYKSNDSSRQFAKNTSSVTNSLAKKLSSKRKVTIDIARKVETQVEIHSEINTERKIYNPNKGHTLTFNWFQINRKLSQQLHLEDVQLIYSSGFFPPVKIYINSDEVPEEWATSSLAEYITKVPADLSSLLPIDAAIVIVAPPYTELTPMSGATTRLASILSANKAREVASQIWQLLGYSNSAPDGLGILAFSNKTKEDFKEFNIELYKHELISHENLDERKHVMADEVKLYNNKGEELDTVYIPNLDIRYKQTEDFIWSRYSGNASETFALPRLLSQEQQVITTNGVFCDAMLGNCTALENYLQRHRDLDLLEKKLEVAIKEIDFEWKLAKDNLVEVPAKLDQTINELVKTNANSFDKRKEVEIAQLNEQKKLHDGEVEKNKRLQEIALLEQQVEELKQKILKMGDPIKYEFDVPEKTNLNINTNISTHDIEEKNVALVVDSDNQ